MVLTFKTLLHILHTEITSARPQVILKSKYFQMWDLKSASDFDIFWSFLLLSDSRAVTHVVLISREPF